MSEKDDTQPEVSSGLQAAALRKLPIRITLTMSAEKWEAFVVSAAKTGGELQRKLAEEVKPHLATIEKAIEGLK